MSGFLDKFRKEVVASVWKDNASEPKVRDIDDKIALGVLLWVVAESDNKFLAQEKNRIKEILSTRSKIPGEDLPVVLASIEKAAKERIDLHTFTREVSEKLPTAVRVLIIEELFRVACIDKELDNRELEAIRKISGLFRLEHKHFIDVKIKIKKEFGLDTAGL